LAKLHEWRQSVFFLLGHSIQAVLDVDLYSAPHVQDTSNAHLRH